MDHVAVREVPTVAPPSENGSRPPGPADGAPVSRDGPPAPPAKPTEPTLPPIGALLPLVSTIARTMRHGLPSVVELGDLIHDGVVGLLESRRRFDPSRGVDFRTYAAYRIRGAILDGLRARDPLPRSMRRALKVTAHLEPPPGIAPVRPAPGVRGVQLVSLEEAGPVAESAEQPEDVVLGQELRADVWRAVGALGARDREIIRLRFLRGWRLREVAAHYGISITRVAELQERAVRRLRRALEVPRPDDLSPNGRRRRRTR